MATWQPPIPAGALYSKAARALGPALPLLAYCYDLVGRDGDFDIVLKDAAGDMEEPYQTMKRWWAIVSAGPFFAEVTDRGKLGFRVKFKPVWIDWRILSARPQANNPIESSTNEVPEKILDNTPNDDQVQIKYKSSTNQVPEKILDEKCIKVLITTDQAKDLRASRAPPSTAHQELLAAYREALGGPIPNGAKEALGAKKILAAGYTPQQAIEVYQYLKAQNWWADKHLSLIKVFEEMGAVLKARKNGSNGNGTTNRSLRSQPRQDIERARWTTDLDRNEPL